MNRHGIPTKIIATLVAAYCLVFSAQAQTDLITQKTKNMKLNAGIITDRIAESRDFYTRLLGLEVTFENDFYLLLHTPGQETAISFLLPGHASQHPFFHKPFTGQGMYLTIEVDDVDKIYHDLKQQGVSIQVDLRDEPWGDRHFAIQDPNGIGVDIVTYAAPQAEE